jgi:deoxyribose-phosphate aldolase
MTGLRPLPRTRAELATMIDHTLLSPEATEDDVRRHCVEALELGVCAVCVNPTMVEIAAGELDGGLVAVAAVVGFPSGAHAPAVKAAEAERAWVDGARELDMVMNLAHALAGAWERVVAEIEAVRAAAPDATLKVIIETGLLDAGAIVDACQAVEMGGADFVKTSTGFHPSGGATVAAVSLMAQTVEGRLGVKASGGIRTTEQALALVQAGATRLGMSKSAAALAALNE